MKHYDPDNIRNNGLLDTEFHVKLRRNEFVNIPRGLNAVISSAESRISLEHPLPSHQMGTEVVRALEVPGAFCKKRCSSKMAGFAAGCKKELRKLSNYDWTCIYERLMCFVLKLK